MRYYNKTKWQNLKSLDKSPAFCMGFLLFLCTCSIANTYYISTTGDNSNNGSIGSPWATLNHAIRLAGAGDTILMRGGTYTTNEVWIRSGQGGANGQYLTIKNYPGEIPSVGGSRRVIVSAEYVRIEGLYFRLPYRLTGNSDWAQIVGNTFYGTQPAYGAIEFYPDNGLIEDNHIEIIGGGGQTGDHGIYLHNGKNSIIRNNYITGSKGYGIHVYDEIKTGDPTDLIKRFENITIENNIILSSRNRSGIMISAGESSSKGIEIDGVLVKNNIIINNAQNGITINYYGKIRNIDIFNNTIYGNIACGLRISADDVDDITVKNNIFSSNGLHMDISSSLDIFDVSHNLYWQPSSMGSGVKDVYAVFEDPSFMDIGVNDFSLKVGSPAIDRGTDSGIPYVGNAPDIGAFEYNHSL